MTTRANEASYRVRTFIAGEELPAEIVAAGADYEIGDVLADMAARFAEIAQENAEFARTDSTAPVPAVTVAITIDPTGVEMARATVEAIEA